MEDKLPDKFKIGAFHPSLFIYAFRRNVLDKLFEEIMQSNVGVLGGEAWVVADEKYFGVIPLKNGDKTVLSWKIEIKKDEEWYDFVERSVKETLTVVSDKNLEKQVTASVRNRLYYHFKFKEESGV